MTINTFFNKILNLRSTIIFLKTKTLKGTNTNVYSKEFNLFEIQVEIQLICAVYSEKQIILKVYWHFLKTSIHILYRKL